MVVVRHRACKPTGQYRPSVVEGNFVDKPAEPLGETSAKEVAQVLWGVRDMHNRAWESRYSLDVHADFAECMMFSKEILEHRRQPSQDSSVDPKLDVACH